MPRDWEAQFSKWAQSPAETETQRCENAIRAIRNAVSKSPKLSRRSIKVFPQGSYRNRVNVRQDSDVDVGVLCHDVFLPHYPAGKTREDFGNVAANYPFSQFKDELEEALVAQFGPSAVTRGNKAFDIHENTYHLEADVAPFFEYRHYYDSGSYICGIALLPESGNTIYNYPERLLDTWPQIPQHYENGVSKNEATRRAYKGVVRILKCLRNEMDAAGIAEAGPIPGFLIECMTWNVPNDCFARPTWDAVVQAVLVHCWSQTKNETSCHEWVEVNDIKYLFRSGQKWTCEQAHVFVSAAWSYVGVR